MKRLRYVQDGERGIRRRRAGRGFSYRDAGGHEPGEATLARIRALAIPPAWTDVWICADARGHIQATGRDARGRKQYRYHAEWRQDRDAHKFERTAAFAHRLGRIRRRLRADLREDDLSLAHVVAAVVALLDRTAIRIGNEEYTRTNGSFGLTTLRDRHLRGNGARAVLAFKGKSGKEHEVAIADARLARIARRCQELPGQRLFQYRDRNGRTRAVRSNDVNDYLRSIAGQSFSAKDFRTWHGTRLAFACLRRRATREAHLGAKQALQEVADALRNTPAVCRGSYVHPQVLAAFEQPPRSLRRGLAGPVRLIPGLGQEESRLLRWLERKGTGTARAAACTAPAPRARRSPTPPRPRPAPARSTRSRA